MFSAQIAKTRLVIKTVARYPVDAIRPNPTRKHTRVGLAPLNLDPLNPRSVLKPLLRHHHFPDHRSVRGRNTSDVVSYENLNRI